MTPGPTRRPRLSARRDDDGFAMLTVIASMFVLSIIVLGATYTATGTIPISRHTQDNGSAMEAAKAGVDDYMQRLSADTQYWSTGNTDATNAALVDPTVPATVDNWRTVPGVPVPAGDPADPASKEDVPQYQYTVLQDFSTIQSFGLITLKVTGKVRNVKRTVLVDLRQQSFLRFAYYTDFETFDPALYPVAGAPPLDGALCAQHHYFSTLSDPVSRFALGLAGRQCLDPAFNSADVINGPLHTNDAILMKGTPTFRSSQTETSWSSTGSIPKPPSPAKLWRTSSDPAARPASCGGCYAPTYAPTIQIPPSNPGLRNAANPAAGGKGCLYTGPTKIVFLSGGGYSIISPNTTSAPAYCGSFPAGGTAQTVTGPKNGVIYVQPVTGVPAGFWPGFPDPADDTRNDPTFGYDPSKGDAFVSGQVAGRYTLGTDGNITIMDNITYVGGLGGTRALGLISTKGFVQVYHPVKCIATPPCAPNLPGQWANLLPTPRSLTIDAAVMSVLHSFIVQNYNRGPALGTLTVVGAVDQAYRGPVATTDPSNKPVSGYAKSYAYDTRLQNFPPPAYINPKDAKWQVQQFSEQKS